MPVDNTETSTGYFVQNRKTVIHGSGTYGVDLRRTTFGPGQHIPEGLLAPDEVARLLANGAIGLKPPVPYGRPTGPNPSGVGLQNGDVQGLPY